MWKTKIKMSSGASWLKPGAPPNYTPGQLELSKYLLFMPRDNWDVKQLSRRGDKSAFLNGRMKWFAAMIEGVDLVPDDILETVVDELRESKRKLAPKLGELQDMCAAAMTLMHEVNEALKPRPPQPKETPVRATSRRKRLDD